MCKEHLDETIKYIEKEKLKNNEKFQNIDYQSIVLKKFNIQY